MADETLTTTEEAAPEAAPATNVPIAYEDASRLVSTGRTAQLALFANIHRDPVRLDGVIKDPLRFREALATLYAIVGSDYRYVPKDRTAYLAYQPVCGTTNIDFSPALFAGVEQMRSYRETRLSIGKEAVQLASTSAAAVLEKRVHVPDSWLRG